MQSLPALANVGGVMLLFFFIYAIIGMNLFGSIKHGDFLNRQANFENFPNAMLVLMRWVQQCGTPCHTELLPTCSLPGRVRAQEAAAYLHCVAPHCTHC